MIKEVPSKDVYELKDEIIQVYHFNKGEGLPRHEHEESHQTFIKQGSAILRTEGREDIVTKDNKIVYLKPYAWHEYEALEDNTILLNIFSK